MMKRNDGIPSHHESKNEGKCFLGDPLNKNNQRKKYLGCLMKRGSTLKTVLLK